MPDRTAALLAPLLRLLRPATPRVRTRALARERRDEARRQRVRRLELWLALHGVDVGPRWIHGVEVAA